MKNYKLIFKQYAVWLYLILNKYFFSFFGLSAFPKKKIIIISRSRTGSTMLINYIRKIPGSFILGEILGRQKKFVFWNNLPALFFRSSHLKKYKLVGFKFFYYHPVDNPKIGKRVFDFLLTNEDIIIIHLIREDLLAVLLSKIIANHTGQWSKKNREVKPKPFNVDTESFKKDLKFTLDSINKIDNLFFCRENYMKISYEEITQGVGLKKLYKLLGHNIDLHVDTGTSQKSHKLYDSILNLKELEFIYEQEKKTFSDYTR